MKSLNILLICVAVLANGQQGNAQSSDRDIISTSRADQRYASTRGVVQKMLADNPPVLKFRPEMTKAEFSVWRDSMAAAMKQLMRHPQLDVPAPALMKTRQADGYRIEKWESYPLPGSVVPFLVLIPDGIDSEHPAKAAALCIPGFGMTKETLAGQTANDYSLEGDPLEAPGMNAMARQYAERGIVAVAVDNPSAGELSDNGVFDYLNTSRILLEMGWSYLGLASYQDKVILDWMKQQPYIPADRIIASGFSLGTEPMMALGLLDPTIHAFVYNDFLCATRERILVMTKPDSKGNRPFPNSIEHLIPQFLTRFDFPDIVCALAPRPIIFTEGGLDRDFDLVRKAYEISGDTSVVECHHYPKFADSSARAKIDEVPCGVDRQEYFNIVNCDPPSHHFKMPLVHPWLRKLGLAD